MSEGTTSVRRIGAQAKQRRAERQAKLFALGGELRARLSGVGRRLVWMIPLAAALLVAGWWGIRQVRMQGGLVVREVRIEGELPMPFVEALQLAGVRRGEPLEKVDADSVASRLAQDPRLAAVKAEIGWDGVLVLRCRAARTVARHWAGDRWQLLLENGYLQEIANSVGQDLPIVESVGEVAWVEVAGSLALLQASDPELWRSLELLVVREGSQEASLWMDSSPVEVLMQLDQGSVTTLRRWRALQQDHVGRLSGVRRLDLRFEGFAYAS